MDVRFLPLGDTALTVEFGNAISPEINSQVHTLYRSLNAARIEGIVEAVPTYRSLTVHYRPECLQYAQLVEICRERLGGPAAKDNVAVAERILEIPVLYGGERGIDLEDVAAYHNKTPEEIVEAHSGHLHRIYMIGFWPGMPYMDAPNGLTIPRRSSPRLNVASGAVIIQSTQTNILPTNTPTGWHIIGYTPVRPFDLKREEVSLFRPGDWVRFLPVDKTTCEEIKARVEAGTYQVNVEERRG